MSEMEYAGKKLEVDDDGFLMDSGSWDELVALGLAEREGVGDLSDEKMAIVRFMREYYQKYKAFPILNYVCKNIHQPRDRVSEEFINPEKAWKIANLPSHPVFISLPLMASIICLRSAANVSEPNNI